MSKRQVWVVEYKARNGCWMTQIPAHSRKQAHEYLSEFRRVNPKLESRVERYVPSSSDAAVAATLRSWQHETE